MRIKKVFDFYSDPGHGWLKVGKAILRELGIADKISGFSYMRGDHAFLEEDCDATVFYYAYQRKHGFPPRWKSHVADKSSRIRSYPGYRFFG